MKKRIAWISLLIVLLIVTGLIGLINSETGSRWLLRRVFSLMPAPLSFETVEGRLSDHIVLTGIHYQSDTETVAVKNLVFAWQPSRLFSGAVKINNLTIDGIDVSLAETEPQPKSDFDFKAGIKLPVQIIVENFLLTDMQLKSGRQLHRLEKLQFSAATGNGQLTVHSLTLNAEAIEAAVQGQIGLGKGFASNIKTTWRADTEQNGFWQGSATVNGDINKLFFASELSSPFKSTLKGHLENLLGDAPRIVASGDWHNLKWPVTGAAPQIQSDQGNIELSGLLSDYQLTVTGQLTQQYFSKAGLFFNGQGGLDAMTIKKLELKSATGLFQVNGDVSWQDAPAFDLTATGQDFNPAFVLPELPGSLTFSSHVKGALEAKALRIDAAINQLSGRLRGYPVSANGALGLNGDQLKVEALRIVSGVNKLAVNGALGQPQDKLVLSMNMPDLKSLWPDLGGILNGEGYLQGALKNPDIKFQAQGKRLHFAEHSAEQLAITINYHPDPQKTSAMEVSAEAVHSGGILLEKLLVEGQGTSLQHGFTASITSPQGNLSAALQGSLKADSWQGAMSKLEITGQEGGLWRLAPTEPMKKAMGIRIVKQAAGMDVTVDKGCLVQRSAFVCTQGQSLANGDLKFDLKANALPTSLMKPYLPGQMDLQGRINADAEIQKQKGVLTGHYQVDMPADATVLLQTDKGATEIPLGASLIAGNIKGNIVSADFDLALAGQDYVRGRLQMNADKTQAITGRISASLAQFSLIEPFTPQLSSIKGLLKADLTVKGSAKIPLVKGAIDITEGAVDMAEVGLRDINFHAVALGDKTNRVQLKGSVLPVTLIKPDSPERLKLKGMITVDADIRQQKDGLAGHYRLDIPANTVILVPGNETATQIPLGASSLAGTIKGDIISADINVALLRQDFLRAQLQMNTGKTRALSGQLAASVVEFALLNALLPQVSDLKGQLKADMKIGGTLEKPAVNGEFHLLNTAAKVAQLGLSLRDINLQAIALVGNAERLQIQGSAKSGEGSVRLDGFVGLQAQSGWPVELMLTGENFEVAKIPEAQIAISPDLKIGFVDGQGKINGILKVPKAIMVLKQLPENAVKVSNDEIIIGEDKGTEKTVTAPGIEADIAVELGKQVSFSGQGLQTDLTGNLRIIKAGEKMTMRGNVDMNKARYKSYGQDLTVRKGRFLFNGPVDNPWLDVEAIRVSKDKKVTAVLALTGPLQSPQTLITSEPALPEADALAYLITGRPLNQVSKSEGNMIASAALSYGAGRVSWVAEKLGIDVLEVEEGETLKDTLVSAGQYLTPDFYVGAKVGLFNKQPILVLKHKLTQTINVETQAGRSQRIKLNYEIDKN